MKLNAVTLSDGRKLSYAEYGKLDGAPVFRFHGTPGAHLITDDEAQLVKEVGLRWIVPDRPGYGYSDFQPDRTLLDWADDVVAIADTLNIDRFGIVAFSGGGPHAVACAYKFPDRLTKVALVSALGPLVLMGETATPMTHERREFKFEQIKSDPDTWLASMISNISGPDGERIKEQGSWRFQYMLEAYRQGVAGAVYDETLILTQPWGFDLEGVTADVYLWQGVLDGNVVPKQGQYMAERIPNCTAIYVPDVGHLMPPNIMEEICNLFIN